MASGWFAYKWYAAWIRNSVNLSIDIAFYKPLIIWFTDPFKCRSSFEKSIKSDVENVCIISERTNEITDVMINEAFASLISKNGLNVLRN